MPVETTFGIPGPYTISVARAPKVETATKAASSQHRVENRLDDNATAPARESVFAAYRHKVYSIAEPVVLLLRVERAVPARDLGCPCHQREGRYTLEWAWVVARDQLSGLN